MKYWCTTGDYGGTGYAQDNRWTCYWNSNDAGWKTGPGDMDCSSGVAGAYNIAFHNVWGTGWDDPIMFPRTGETWTETLNSLAANRGFMDIGDTWYGSTPSGGFHVGDMVLKLPETADMSQCACAKTMVHSMRVTRFSLRRGLMRMVKSRKVRWVIRPATRLT